MAAKKFEFAPITVDGDTITPIAPIIGVRALRKVLSDLVAVHKVHEAVVNGAPHTIYGSPLDVVIERILADTAATPAVDTAIATVADTAATPAVDTAIATVATPAKKVSKATAVANATLTNAEIDSATAPAVAYAASGKTKVQAAKMAGLSTLSELLEKDTLSGAEWQITATVMCSKDSDVSSVFNSLRTGENKLKVKPAILHAVWRVESTLRNATTLSPREYTKLGKLASWLTAINRIIAGEINSKDTVKAIEAQRIAENTYISECLAETLGI